MKRVNRYIVQGQRVDPVKVQAAKKLSQEMIDAEALLWQALRRNQLRGLHFRRQQLIDGFVVDFYCPRTSLVIEVDGRIHIQQKASDAERDVVLRARGLQILRIRNEDVQGDLPAVLERILQYAEGATQLS